MLSKLSQMSQGLLFLHGHFPTRDAVAAAHRDAASRPPSPPSPRAPSVGPRQRPTARTSIRATAVGLCRSCDWLTAAELLLLGAIWGGSFLFMRISAGQFGPLALVDVRLALGALVLAPFLWQARRHFTPALWWRVAGIGLVNSLLPFILFAWGAERAPAGVGAIVNSMAVPFTALAAFAAFGERIGGARAMGLVAGFIGVIVLASGNVAGARIGQAVAAGTIAALSYGISANLVKHYLADVPPIAFAAATLTSGALLLAPFAAANWPATPIATGAWISAVALGVLCTGVAYAFYFRLIRRVGAPRAATATYLVPLFGVAWGWLLLGEALTPTMAGAGVLILASVVLAQRGARAAVRPMPVPGPAGAVHCGS
jgi:drug/metabolite transporter (DMT)-like permease